MANAKKPVRVTMTLPDGTRKYYSGRTKKEAESKRDKAKLMYAMGYDAASNLTFAELAESWLDYYRTWDLHKRTIETTEGIINRYLIPELGCMRVTDIKPIHIDKMLKHLGHLSKSTQKKVLTYAGMLFDLAIENGIIPKSPTYKKKPIAKDPDKVESLTDDQCRVLLEATKGSRVYPFIVVVLFCGLRKGEALGLMWDDIDFENRYLRVNRSIVYTLDNRQGEINKDMKTNSARRTIPFSQEVYDVLIAEKRKSNSKYVFSMRDGHFLSEASFRRMWDLVSYRSVGGPGTMDAMKKIDFSVHPHQLRHTYCTRLIANGVQPKEAQYLMGHASPDITMAVYTDYIEEQQLASTAEKIRHTSLSL